MKGCRNVMSSSKRGQDVVSLSVCLNLPTIRPFLSLLKKKWPEEEFALIIGEDNLRDFHKWRNAKEIVENYRILVYPRKGEGVSASMWENLFLIDAPLADVSSTEIREMLGEGQDISPYVPQPALPLILNYYSVK